MSQLYPGLAAAATGLAALTALGMLSGCSASKEPAPEGQAVVATIYPLEYFASQIGGDKVRVVGLVPPGAEAHDWEPSPRNIAAIEKASVFVYNGAGFEPWVGRLLPQLVSRRLMAVDATQGLDLQEAGGEGGRRDEHKLDPHVWVDPLLARRQVALIQEGLARADPDSQPVYAANAQKLMDRLDQLHQSLKAGLARCRRRDIFVSHNAFGYLGKRYDLRIHPIAGLTPDAEPTPSQMAEFVQEARRNDATHIFFETAVSPALAQTIAREVGAKTLVLDPIETLTPEGRAQGWDYFDLMQTNLQHLQLALGCSSG